MHAKVADVTGENLAVYAEPDGRSNIAGVMASFPDLAPQHVYRTSHIMSLMTYVSSGLGVAFVPSPMQSLNFRGVVYLEVTDPLPQMEMKLLWRTESARATISNYIECVQLCLERWRSTRYGPSTSENVTRAQLLSGSDSPCIPSRHHHSRSTCRAH